MTPEAMTPSQCRAARALRDLAQADLARAAGLDLSTVADLETGRPVAADAVAAVRRALEGAGVEFVAGGEVSRTGGPGVRLKAQPDEGLRPSELTSENDV